MYYTINEPFRHPNTWIREATENYIKFISDPSNKMLTAAEAYCLVRPEVKKFKKHSTLKFERDTFKVDQTFLKREK